MEDATRIEVGVRDLRDHLSAYLEQVKDGIEVVVTEHGRPIAFVTRRPRSPLLEQLIAEGKARPPLTNRRSLPVPVEFSGTDADLDALVREQRQ